MDVLKNRYIYLWISAVLFVISILLFIVPKLNLGIDLTGGTQTEYTYTNNVSVADIKAKVEKEKEAINSEKNIINDIKVYKITGENKIAVVTGFYPEENIALLEENKNIFKQRVTDLIVATDPTAAQSKYTNIGKSFGDYIKNTAFITLGLAIIAITFYVTYAFSGVVSGISIMSFAVITIITLFHDVLISSGFYIFTSFYFPEFKIDTFFITALLTILWYSINDTIVVFDRVRSNLKAFGGKKGKEWKDLKEIINISVTETIRRSLYTSLTLLFVLISIFFFGPEAIKGFILVMIFGTIIGTYSSIFIASPILFEANKNKKLTIYKKVVVDPNDKIVV